MSQALQTQTPKRKYPEEWRKMYDAGYANGLRVGIARGGTTKGAPDLEYQRQRDERMFELFTKALNRPDPLPPDIKIDLPPPAPVTVNLPSAERTPPTVRIDPDLKGQISILFDEERNDLWVVEGKKMRGTLGSKKIFEYDPFTKQWTDTGETTDQA